MLLKTQKIHRIIIICFLIFITILFSSCHFKNHIKGNYHTMVEGCNCILHFNKNNHIFIETTGYCCNNLYYGNWKNKRNYISAQIDSSYEENTDISINNFNAIYKKKYLLLSNLDTILFYKNNFIRRLKFRLFIPDPGLHIYSLRIEGKEQRKIQRLFGDSLEIKNKFNSLNW